MSKRDKKRCIVGNTAADFGTISHACLYDEITALKLEFVSGTVTSKESTPYGTRTTYDSCLVCTEQVTK